MREPPTEAILARHRWRLGLARVDMTRVESGVMKAVSLP